MIYQNNNGIITQTSNIYENKQVIQQINNKYENVDGIVKEVYDGSGSKFWLVKNGVLQVESATTAGAPSSFFNYIKLSEPRYRYLNQFNGYTEIWGGTQWSQFTVTLSAITKVVISGTIKYYGKINGSGWDMILTSILGTSRTVRSSGSKDFIYEEEIHNKTFDIGVISRLYFGNKINSGCNFYIQFYGDVYGLE